MDCGFEWMAPGQIFDGKPYTRVLKDGLLVHREIGRGIEKQVCVLRRNHVGDHRSATDVTSSMLTRR